MSRRVASVVLILFSLFIPQPGHARESGVWIGAESQIFIDDSLVSAKSGMERHTHPCTKPPRPVLGPEMNWERDGDDQRVYVYGTVLRDPETGAFRMWYNRLSGVLYATSEDGLRWNRPRLNLAEFQGTRENNCVLTSLHSPSVVYNPDAAPKERYAMLGYKGGNERGYRAAYSEDGLHWHLYLKNPVLPSGDTCTLMYDPKSGAYLAFHKRNVKWRGHERRTVYLAESRDMQAWSKPLLVMAPDEIDDAQIEKEGGRFGQFYNMSAFPYGDQYLGFVTLFHFTGPPERKGPLQSNDDGPIDVQLVHSRDGRSWERCEDRTPVIPNGPYAYDAGCILGVANGVVATGDEIWTYYTAITTTHGGFVPEKRITIGLAKWRLDGFVSLDAGEETGIVRTVPLNCEGNRLYVNAASESLTAAVLDASGTPLSGYAHEDCETLQGDFVRHAVTWKRHTTLPDDRPLCFEFRMKNAQLYSFRIAAG